MALLPMYRNATRGCKVPARPGTKTIMFNSRESAPTGLLPISTAHRKSLYPPDWPVDKLPPELRPQTEAKPVQPASLHPVESAPGASPDNFVSAQSEHGANLAPEVRLGGPFPANADQILEPVADQPAAQTAEATPPVTKPAPASSDPEGKAAAKAKAKAAAKTKVQAKAKE